jgi:hypothetical protein
MGGFGGKSMHMTAYFAFAACSKSRWGEIQLKNAQKPVQRNSSSTLI